MSNIIKPMIFNIKDLEIKAKNGDKLSHYILGRSYDSEENTSEWINIKELLQKEKILSNIIILDRFFIKGLIDDKYNFEMNIQVDEEENILGVNYKLK